MSRPGPYRDAQSTREWLSLAARFERAATLLAEDRLTTVDAYVAAGHAVECAMKAYIMHAAGMARWPTAAERPDLHVHGLQRLSAAVGLRPSPQDPVAPAWAVFLRWDVKWRYSTVKMSRRAARDVNRAAFGTDGVVPWLKSFCR